MLATHGGMVVSSSVGVLLGVCNLDMKMRWRLSTCRVWECGQLADAWSSTVSTGCTIALWHEPAQQSRACTLEPQLPWLPASQLRV